MPILFDCNEVLLIQGEYYTQPLTINLDRVICMKAGKVAGERTTQIRLADYIPGGFVWMHIEGSFDDIRQQMRSVASSRLGFDSDGLKPLGTSSELEPQTPEGATRFPRSH